MRGTYLGWRVNLFKRTALLRAGKRKDRVLAQFDFPAPLHSDKQVKANPPTPEQEPYCFGWHEFDANDFEIMEALG